MRLGYRGRRSIAAIVCMGLFYLGMAPTARAVDLQVQTEWQSFTVKPTGQPAQTKSSFQNSYNLAYRNALSPWANIQSFLTVNSTDYSDQINQQSNRNVVFNLLSQQRTYTLSGGIDESRSRSATSLLGGPTIADSGTNNYNVNFVWQESALPSVNLQYRQSTNSVTSGLSRSSYSTKTWLQGAYYEFAPFRLTFDRQKQTYDFTGGASSTHSDTTRSRYGMNFEQKLLNGLDFTGDFSKDTTSSRSQLLGTTIGGNSTTLRLTATPTSSVLLSLDRSFFTSGQATQLLQSKTKSDSTTLSLRSDIVTGLSLSATDMLTNDRSDLLNSRNRNQSVTLGAILTPDVMATVGWNKSTFSPDIGDGSVQKNTYVSFRLPLGMETDMNFDAGFSDSVSAGAGFRGRYAGFTARNHTRSDMSLGVGYRWNGITQTGIGAASGRQTTQSIDFDMGWTPSSTLGINATANYYVTGGTTISDYISPTVDLRWEPSSQSNLTLRYNFNHSRQWDPLLAQVLGQSARGISARFSYRLSRKSSLDITYDLQSATTGGIDYQRAVRVFFRTGL